MKSTEVNGLLRDRIAPEMKSLGFKREKSLLSWSRHHGDLYTVVWCQVSQDGWDEYAGSKFTVEFQRSIESVVGSASKQRQRVGKLISDVQREEVRHRQNRVVASLRRPPEDHPILSVSPDVTKWYLAIFEQDPGPYPQNHDIWLRYASPEHVEDWSVFLVKVLHQCVETIEQSAESTKS